MFLSHFAMTDHPFSSHITPAAIFQDERMTQGLARLNFFLKHSPIALMTGEEGVGKSTLIRLFLNQLDQNRFSHAYLHFTPLSSLSFLKLIAHSLGEIPKQYKDQVILQITSKIKTQDKTTLLLVDEAHLLLPQVLIDLRLLISSALDDSQQLKILLSAHPSLKKELRRSIHSALLQRISLCYDIPPLSPQQTPLYLDFHLRRVGASEKLFDQDVKHDIHEYSRGVPRLINNIATACLIHAACEKLNKINATVLTNAFKETHCSASCPL